MLKRHYFPLIISMCHFAEVSTTPLLCALTISTFVPTKQHLRGALLFCLNLKKSGAEGHWLLCETHGKLAPSIKTCEYWFRRFKSGNFDTSDKEREARPVKFEDAELEALLDQDSCQTQEELAETLGVTQQAISNRLKAMGMLRKQEYWVLHELKPRDVKRRFSTCPAMHQFQRLNRIFMARSYCCASDGISLKWSTISYFSLTKPLLRNVTNNNWCNWAENWSLNAPKMPKDYF